MRICAAVLLSYLAASGGRALANETGAVAAQAPPGTATLDGGAVNGLYPLWEHTAVLHESGGQIGYAHAQVRLGRLQIGAQPFLALYGTANGQAKVALWREPRVRAALMVGGYLVPTQAQSRGIGNLNASGFTNPYSPVWLWPITVAGSFALNQRLHLHAASTMLLARSTRLEDTHTSFGQSAMAELRGEHGWSATLHAGIEGLGVSPRSHLGLSFGRRTRHLALAVGFARRVSWSGETAGTFMFDGAVLFR